MGSCMCEEQSNQQQQTNDKQPESVSGGGGTTQEVKILLENETVSEIQKDEQDGISNKEYNEDKTDVIDDQPLAQPMNNILDNIPNKVTQFKQIDAGLKLYYESLGINNYANSHGIGKFLEYCIQNECDEDDIKDELNMDDPGDCIYIEFDKNFPFKKGIKFKHDADRKKQILMIIKYCYDNIFNQWELQLTSDEYRQYKNIYSLQCKQTFIGRMDNESFWYGLCVGLKNNIPFAQYLTVIYMRKSIEKLLENKGKAFNLTKWVNVIIKSINYQKIIIPDTDKEIAINELIECVINYYMERLVPEFNFINNNKSGFIKDNINDIAKYLTDSCIFIKSIKKFPFQFDFVIALNATNPDSSDYDSDDSSDDEKEIETNGVRDCIGDIHKNLKQNNCAYYNGPITDGFTKSYSQFIDILRRKYLKQKKSTYLSDYPSKRRMIGFLDKRNKICIMNNDTIEEIENTNKNKLTFYEPTSDCREYPDYENTHFQIHCPEWNLETTQKCLIPNIMYPERPKVLKSNVLRLLQTKSSLTHCNGKLLTFSYHIELENEIRCYMWWRGKCIILTPEYIDKLLPKIFTKSDNFTFDVNQISLWTDNKLEKIYKNLTKIAN
eukprot:95304_1